MIKRCVMKFYNYSFYFLFSLMLIFAGCASSRKPALNHGDSSYGQAAPSSRTPGGDTGSMDAIGMKQGSKKKSAGVSRGKTHADLVREYEERMEANAKRYEKEAKLAEKPQYSDFSYFGHKKKPKKRPVGKRKFCKECGIVH